MPIIDELLQTDKKIKFVVPTLFHRKDSEIACIESLCSQALAHNKKNEIHVVCNYENDDFVKWEPSRPQIQKHVSNLMHNISKALNIVASQNNTSDFDYFCFLHSDMLFTDHHWIQKCIDIHNTNKNIGIIGSRGHSTFSLYHKPITDVNISGVDRLYEVLWSDGIMFFATNLFETIGYFDEQYFGDCESQDFCYKAFEKGFINLYVPIIYLNGTHGVTGFGGKSPKSSPLLDSVKQSQNLFKKKWGPISNSWINKQKL
jgi:GT2 family glycosyltransferase